MLFDVQPRDPATFAAVVAVLTAAGLLACYIPARTSSEGRSPQRNARRG